MFWNYALPHPLSPQRQVELNIRFQTKQRVRALRPISELRYWQPRLWWDGLPVCDRFEVRLETPPGYAVAASGRFSPTSGAHENEGVLDLDQVRKNLAVSLAERIACSELKRQAHPTESLAVGSRQFLEKSQPLISRRLETEIAITADDIRALPNTVVPYGQETGPKSVSRPTLQR